MVIIEVLSLALDAIEFLVRGAICWGFRHVHLVSLTRFPCGSSSCGVTSLKGTTWENIVCSPEEWYLHSVDS